MVGHVRDRHYMPHRACSGNFNRIFKCFGNSNSCERGVPGITHRGIAILPCFANIQNFYERRI